MKKCCPNTHTHAHTHTYTYIYTYTHTHTHICIHTHIYVCIYTQIRIYLYTNMHIYMYINTYTYIHTHTYRHIYKHVLFKMTAKVFFNCFVLLINTISWEFLSLIQYYVKIVEIFSLNTFHHYWLFSRVWPRWVFFFWNPEKFFLLIFEIVTVQNVRFGNRAA